jgi:hypothetical protein
VEQDVLADGFITRPFTLADKSLLLVSEENIVYEIAQDGSILWEMTLDAALQAYPYLNGERVYLVDRAGNLYVFNAQGLIWRYKPEGETKGTTGALVGPAGTIYYIALVDRIAYLHALSPDGTLKWATPVRTSFFYDDLQINGPGSLLFLKEDIFDTQQGVLLDVEPPFDVDEYIMGQDGLNYLRSGHTVMQWELTDEGMQIVETAQWNYQGLSSVARRPYMAWVTPPQIIWLHYGEWYIWLALDGTVLGSPPTADGILFYFDFLNTRITFCDQEPGDAVFICDVYTTASDEPSENFSFIGIPDTEYGGFVHGETYAITNDNILYKIDVTLPSP